MSMQRQDLDGFISLNKPNHSILLTVANNARKSDLTQILGDHRDVMNARYDVIAGTSHSLEIAKEFFPGKQSVDLGPGDEFGDIRAITYMIDQLAAGHRLEALVLFDPDVERHQPYKLALLLSLIKVSTVVWWPTPASATAFLSSLTSPALMSAVTNGDL